jgi:RNA polymerase sigma factor (sigma-70 family)
MSVGIDDGGIVDPIAMTEPASGVERHAVVRGRMDRVTEVYDSCHAELFGYAVSLTRDREAAEDIVHEAFTRFVQELSSVRSIDEPRAWLYRVCTNLAFSRSRRFAIVDRWRSMLDRTAAERIDEAAEETVLRRERDAELHLALRSLPAESRAALLLAADGFSGREIATVLGRSEGATRNLMWRSRSSLRDVLEGGDS